MINTPLISRQKAILVLAGIFNLKPTRADAIATLDLAVEDAVPNKFTVVQGDKIIVRGVTADTAHDVIDILTQDGTEGLSYRPHLPTD